MKKTIRLSESELHNIVKETVMSVLNENIDEFEDWKAQMLHSYKDEPLKGTSDYYINGNRYYIDDKLANKANKMAQSKYNNKGVSNNGIGYENDINVSPSHGKMNSAEYAYDDNGTLTQVNHRGDVDIEKGISGYSSNNKHTSKGVLGIDYGYHDLKINTPEANDFQTQAGNDMIDYYSGNYANRLKQKASQLGNAKSGQDFTPKRLREAVARAIRKYLR